MTKSILLAISFLFSTLAFGQKKEQAEKLVEQGVAYHDKGDYEGAIKKYDKALELDQDNLLALTEKAYSLLMLQKYDETIACCEKAIQKHPGEKDLSTTYVTYGNAMDALKKTDRSLEIYAEGLKQFPNNYQLQFNRGITLSSVRQYDEAIQCFKKSMTLKPTHPGSHNAIAQLLNVQNKRIPALLAFCRFLVLEPQSKRAKENLASMQGIMKGNVEKTGKKSVTIKISPDMLADTTEDGEPKENSFITTDLILAMDAGLDYDKKNKNKSEVEQFIRKFETVCSSLKESKKDNYGFYWSYYVPYFIEMKDNNLVETFAYVAFASSEDPEVSKWLKGHKAEIDKFYEWSKGYSWSQN